jgi:hypothetical protein
MDTNQVIVRDLAAEEFTTGTVLTHTREQAVKRRYEDFSIVDVDSHHYEAESFTQILEYPAIRASTHSASRMPPLHRSNKPKSRCREKLFEEILRPIDRPRPRPASA